MAVLRNGDKGPEVLALQKALVAQGYKLVPDGKFGQATFNNLAAFQRSKGLVADGVAGNKTLSALGLIKSILDEIPMPTANRSRAAAMVTLQAIEKITQVDAKLLATFASIESAFDYTVKASTSSATGWFQFINQTWDAVLKQNAQYGLVDDANRSLRIDPRANGLMGAEFLKGNDRILSKSLGRHATDTELYAAHFFGAGTAAKFLTLPGKRIAADEFPKQAAANPGIFTRNGVKLTIDEVKALFETKVAAHRG